MDGQANDRVRRSGRRRQAEAPAGPRLFRAATVSRHGGRLLADQLVIHGADTVFSVPGESLLALLDGLYDAPIRLITCRHEGGAANTAHDYAEPTARPGIAVVTRRPGAPHACVDG